MSAVSGVITNVSVVQKLVYRQHRKMKEGVFEFDATPTSDVMVTGKVELWRCRWLVSLRSSKVGGH